MLYGVAKLQEKMIDSAFFPFRILLRNSVPDSFPPSTFPCHTMDHFLTLLIADEWRNDPRNRKRVPQAQSPKPSEKA